MDLFKSRSERSKRFDQFLHMDVPEPGRSLEIDLRKLENLLSKELRTLGDVVTLEHYIHLGIVPQRLRWDLEIHEGDESSETKEFWNKFFNDCGIMLLKTLVERKRQRLNIINEEIKKLEGSIRPHDKTETYINLTTNIKIKLDKEESEIKKRKQRKLKRDQWEYRMGQVYKWQRKGGSGGGPSVHYESHYKQEGGLRHNVEVVPTPFSRQDQAPGRPLFKEGGRPQQHGVAPFWREGRHPKGRWDHLEPRPQDPPGGQRTHMGIQPSLPQRQHWKFREGQQMGSRWEMNSMTGPGPQWNRNGPQGGTQGDMWRRQEEPSSKEPYSGNPGWVGPICQPATPGNKKRKLREDVENGEVSNIRREMGSPKVN